MTADRKTFRGHYSHGPLITLIRLSSLTSRIERRQREHRQAPPIFASLSRIKWG
jgi:hypothetical protein